MNRKFTSTVTGAAIFIASIGILSRSIGFIREIIYANSFGLDKNFDIYLVGAILPTILNTAILYLAQNYFIPAYHKYPSENPEERILFLNKSLWLFILIGIVLSLLLFLFKDAIINNYLWNSDRITKETALVIFQLFILSIPVNAAYSIICAYLQAEYKFIHPTLSQMFLNIPIIILVILFNRTWGIYTIGIGFLMGNILQLFYLWFVSRGKISIRIFYLINKGKISFGFTSGLFIVILIEVINQLYVFIDRYFYNYVDVGGIASLNYASVLYLLPISVFSFALSTAIFPKFAENFNEKNFEKLEYYFNRTLNVIIMTFIPLSLIYFTDGDNIIKLVFQHGRFESADTIVTYKALQMYTISIVFYSLYTVVNKMIYSAGLVKQLLFISCILIVLKTILNIFLVPVYKQNGLALASSISYTLLCLCCLWLIYNKVKFHNKLTLIIDLILFLSLACLSYYITNCLLELFFINWFLHFGLKVILFCGIYISSLIILKIRICLDN